MEVSSCSVHALCDDTLAEVLVRLDAVSVLRCRAVCTRWRRIATARSFLAARAAHRPREMIVLNEHGITRCSIPPSPDPDVMVTGDGHRYLFDPRPRAADGTLGESCFQLRASLDGLLVLEYCQLGPFSETRCPATYIVCNPVTRQWTHLPALRSPAAAAAARRSYFRADVWGFYFHASSGEHRVLFCCEITPGAGGEDDVYLCVVSVGSGAPPRRLPLGPPLPGYGFPVPYRGALHWSCQRPLHAFSFGVGDIMAFDTASETFRLIPQPPVLDEQARVSVVVADLLELEGDLCVAAMRDYVALDIWALQDYGAAENRWTLRHRVNVQRPAWTQLRCNLGIVAPIKVVSVGSGAVLIGFPCAEGWLYSLQENGVRREIDFMGSPVVEFSESLVPHAFFDLLPRCPEVVPLNFSNRWYDEMMLGSTSTT